MFDFTYEVIFEKKSNDIKIISYNSPWNNGEEASDFLAMFKGLDETGRSVQSYKVVPWEIQPDGQYKACVRMILFPSIDGFHDQVFSLLKLETC